MCKLNDGQGIAEEDTVAFKVVSVMCPINRYFSQWKPDYRDLQKGFEDSPGEHLEYIIGQELTSKPPGIFLFKTKWGAIRGSLSNDAVLKILIPAKTIIRHGIYSFDIEIITAERIKVLEKIDNMEIE